MRLIQTCICVFVMCVGLVFAASAATGANATSISVGDQDFLLVNSTGVEIHALFVTPHSSKRWGEDILGVDTLPDGDDVLITFPDKTKTKFWDLRIEDEEGNFIEWDNLNLLTISRVELFYKKGKATADLQ